MTRTDYYGIGNNAGPDDFEQVTGRSVEIKTLYEHRVWDHTYLGVEYHVSDVVVDSVEPGGRLAGGAVAGAEGGLWSGVGFVGTWDGRDNTVFARRGGFVQVGLRRFDAVVGSDFDFSQTRLDLRHYVELIPGHVLAVRAYGVHGTGEAPYQALADLGGGVRNRGYAAGRFRDRSSASVFSEYRWEGFWRLGFVAFASAGQVMAEVEQIRLSRFHPAVGAGVRLRGDRQRSGEYAV